MVGGHDAHDSRLWRHLSDHADGQSTDDVDRHPRNRDVRAAGGHLWRGICRRDSKTKGREDDLPALRRGDRLIAWMGHEIGRGAFSIFHITFFICHWKISSSAMTDDECNMENGKCPPSMFQFDGTR